MPEEGHSHNNRKRNNKKPPGDCEAQGSSEDHGNFGSNTTNQISKYFKDTRQQHRNKSALTLANVERHNSGSSDKSSSDNTSQRGEQNLEQVARKVKSKHEGINQNNTSSGARVSGDGIVQMDREDGPEGSAQGMSKHARDLVSDEKMDFFWSLELTVEKCSHHENQAKNVHRSVQTTGSLSGRKRKIEEPQTKQKCLKENKKGIEEKQNDYRNEIDDTGEPQAPEVMKQHKDIVLTPSDEDLKETPEVLESCPDSVDEMLFHCVKEIEERESRITHSEERKEENKDITNRRQTRSQTEPKETCSQVGKQEKGPIVQTLNVSQQGLLCNLPICLL